VAKLEDSIVKEGSNTTAAFVVQSIMVVSGLLIPPRTYFPGIKQVLGNVMDRSGLGGLKLSD
jgi:adenosylmethionine-8-amino-7-oxononanoate aminotransferase